MTWRLPFLLSSNSGADTAHIFISSVCTLMSSKVWYKFVSPFVYILLFVMHLTFWNDFFGWHSFFTWVTRSGREDIFTESRWYRSLFIGICILLSSITNLSLASESRGTKGSIQLRWQIKRGSFFRPSLATPSSDTFLLIIDCTRRSFINTHFI